MATHPPKTWPRPQYGQRGLGGHSLGVREEGRGWTEVEGQVEGSETQRHRRGGTEGERGKEVEGKNEGEEEGERQAGSRQGGEGRVERRTDKW